MPATIIFRDLPATFPSEDRYRRPATIGSILTHTFMLIAVIVVPMLFTASLPDMRLLTFVAPPAPPPRLVTTASLPQAPAADAALKAIPREAQPVLFNPTTIPPEVARIADVPLLSIEAGSGVEGGIPGGTMPPVLADMLARPSLPIVPVPMTMPAPPPPPAVQADVREEIHESPVRLDEFYPLKTIRTTPPVYPPAAKLARIQGAVLLELTLNETGRVDEVQVVSGHPILTRAALECVRNWLYEPPVLNGKAVRVVIPVHVNFRLQL